MFVLRSQPKGARFASFGLGLCVFALMPTEIGYQDIASLLARQPGVAERWQKRVFSAAGTIQVATFSFGRPIGTSSPQTATYRLASLDNQGIDITGSVTRDLLVAPPPRYRAADIAVSADFFSFGTNDLTQTTFGLSRDDSTRFLGAYERTGILAHDPFVSLDTDGVGELVRIACERGRKRRPALKLGICGEHGGDPASIRFCASVGLDYVSCSPYRVPIARLAAAQAALGKTVASQA